MKTAFQLVAAMNVAFGNPAQPGNMGKLYSQCKNIAHEFGELQIAFGHNKPAIDALVEQFLKDIENVPCCNIPDMEKVRDALRDIVVFADGGTHIAGYDGDQDMRSVITGVMSRFIRDEDDKQATIAKHAAKGVTDVYFEGEFPTMIMKSGSDQPDAPKGKFLKSASYSEPVFARDHQIESPMAPYQYGSDLTLEMFALRDLVQGATADQIGREMNLTMMDWSKTLGSFRSAENQSAYKAFMQGLQAAQKI